MCWVSDMREREWCGSKEDVRKSDLRSRESARGACVPAGAASLARAETAPRRFFFALARNLRVAESAPAFLLDDWTLPPSKKTQVHASRTLCVGATASGCASRGDAEQVFRMQAASTVRWACAAVIRPEVCLKSRGE